MANDAKKRGSARMTELGLIPIQIWVTSAEAALIRSAAKHRERWASISAFVRTAALRAAELLAKS